MEMRLITTLSLVLLLSAFAIGQVAIVGGTATSAPAGYDVYAAPFTPRVVTPSINLTSSTDGSTHAVVYSGDTTATPVLYVQSAGSSMPAMTAHRGDLGVASAESDISAKAIMSWYGPAKKATRTYTNADIDRFNQATGTVKYDGKTEQMK
jgi:hypothetical protein